VAPYYPNATDDDIELFLGVTPEPDNDEEGDE
jgi:hypothetical protein